jgi:hypothetical protein
MKRRPKLKVGDKIVVQYRHDKNDQWWWRLPDKPTDVHGPFATKAAAEKDSTDTIFGEQCVVRHGGRWDPSWDKEQ